MSFVYLKSVPFKLDFLYLRKVTIQILNLNNQVSLPLKLIVHITLALIYGTFFSSVAPTYVISQLTSLANAQINKSLFTDERTRKIISAANSFQICV